jgi:hypothetical protein
MMLNKPSKTPEINFSCNEKIISGVLRSQFIKNTPWFHVEHYLPISTKRTLISLGETPDIREACPIVCG